jgi:murein L,D-transpeptidase YcbB/YkuD
VEVLLWIFVAFLAMVVTSVVIVVLVVRSVIRRIRRSRALAGRALRTRARFTTGPRGQVLRLRVRLADALASERAAVDLAAQGAGPRGELERLHRRIAEEGEALDRQLRFMESETDPAATARDLPVAEGRVDQVTALVRRVRSAVGSQLDGLTDDSLAALRTDVEREVTALHAGVQQLRLLNAHDGLGDPVPDPSTGRLNRSR